MIRLARVDDAAQIVSILVPEITQGSAHFATRVPTEGEIVAEIESLGRHVFLVAEVDGSIQAFARSHPWKAREAYTWTCELGIYVRGDRRRTGVGRELVAALLAELQGRGFRTFMGGIVLPNAASVGLTESFGFVKVAHLPKMGFKHGEWRDVGYWSKHVGEGAPE